MLVLFDHSVPAPLSAYLIGHTVTEARNRGWDTLSNSDLLTEAERAGFDVFLTADKNIRYQQNLAGRRLAVVVLSTPQWPEEVKDIARADRGNRDQPQVRLRQHMEEAGRCPRRELGAIGVGQGHYRDPQEFVESIPFTETRKYVQAILRNASVYRQLYGAP